MPTRDDDQRQAINHFANRLVPEAFEREYTAYDISHVNPPGPFDDWIEERIEFALSFGYPTGGRPTGMIQVERAGLRATWHGCTFAGCRLSEESAHVQREVAHFDQPWLFAIDTWGPDEVWEQYDNEATGFLDEVLTHPRPRWRAPWYAEARGRGVARIAKGVIVMDMADRIGSDELEPGTSFERDARRPLRGHPDRRRHRLR
jgi:hypothetical protein